MRFVSGHRLSDAGRSPQSDAPLGAAESRPCGNAKRRGASSYGTGKNHYALSGVLARAGAGSARPRLCRRDCFSRLDPRQYCRSRIAGRYRPRGAVDRERESTHGERSASLEFVHHLKAPMVDFIRRPPEPRESAHPPEEPVIVNTGPNVEAAELPAEAPQPLPQAVSPAADVLPAPELDREEGARLISRPEPLPSVPVEPPSACAVEATTIARTTPVEPMPVEPTLVETTLVETTPAEPREKTQPAA